MAVILLCRALLEFFHHRGDQILRHRLHQQRENHVHLASGPVQARFRPIETVMDQAGQFLVPQAEAYGVGRLVQHLRHLLQIQIYLAEGAVVHQVHRDGIVHVHPLGGRPVPQVPTAVLQVGPLFQKAFDRIGIHIIQPVLHRRIKPFQRAFVGIVHVRAPGGLHQETAPVGTAAGRIGIGGGMGQAAVGTLGIGPGLQPVQVQRGNRRQGLQEKGGSIAVAAITQALDAGTVHHIAVEGKVLRRPLHQGIDSVEVFIRACETAPLREIGPHPQGTNGQGLLRKAVQLHIAEYMVVEAVQETVSLRGSGRDVRIVSADFGVQVVRSVVPEQDGRHMAFRKARQGHLQQAVHHLSEIHQVSAGTFVHNAHRFQDFLDHAGFAHLHGGFHPFHLHHLHRAPFRFHAGVDDLPGELVGAPGPAVGIAAPGSFPGGVRPDGRNAVQVQFGPDQRPLEGRPESGGLVPARPGGDQQFVPSFPKQAGHIIYHDERASVQLRDGRIQYRFRNLSSIQGGFVITQGIHVQKRLGRHFLQLERFSQKGRSPLPGHSADVRSLHLSVQQAHAEMRLPAPGRHLAVLVPDPDPPPGLLPGGKRRPAVRNHHLLRAFHLAGTPEVRPHFDLVSRLLHGAFAEDRPTEMRLGRIDAQRLHKALAAHFLHVESGLAAGGEQGGRQHRKHNPQTFHNPVVRIFWQKRVRPAPGRS